MRLTIKYFVIIYVCWQAFKKYEERAKVEEERKRKIMEQKLKKQQEKQAAEQATGVYMYGFLVCMHVWLLYFCANSAHLHIQENRIQIS